jgi:TPR repeat protein
MGNHRRSVMSLKARTIMTLLVLAIMGLKRPNARAQSAKDLQEIQRQERELADLERENAELCKTLDRSKHWLAMALAPNLERAEKASAVEQFELGLKYLWGVGFTQDYQLAAKWFTRAGEQGHAEAQYRLASLYQAGLAHPDDPLGLAIAKTEDSRAFEKDALAEYWFHKAAEQGYAKAQIALGGIYLNGSHAVLKDPHESIKWFRKAADQDDPSGQELMAYVSLRGLGTPQDEVAAYMWFSLAFTHEPSCDFKGNSKMLYTSLGRTMNRDELAEARRLARSWKPSASK